ncbi:MAG: pth, peptidyl-tRNA hydrolase [Candidatus Saccharibacteria bacterium]|nr:pth, peptidyl-tRNA hydrolase [Candidatus Saccharibacteria bacterium]
MAFNIDFLYTSDMKIIFAQGNPGAKHEHNRHNVGFLALDFYAQHMKLTFQGKAKFNADIAETEVNGEKVLLVKPSNFYNETGQSARSLVDFYKIETTDILVLHDELALPFGTLRTREKGSDAGNNGIKSLNAHLGENYSRLRIGTWNELADKQGSFDFVLTNFSKEESDKLQSDVFPKVGEIINDFIAGDHEITSVTV